jgi:ABC-2 type transport system ATP-binding protein
MILEVQNISKSFSGKQILYDVSFKAESGKAMGFLGRNGAGKTTTIRALMNVFAPDSGEFLLDGKVFKRKDYKVGYLPEERGMYAKVPIIDQLVYFGELKHMNRLSARESAHKWLEFMGLSEYEKKPLDTLSRGNQQKIQIIQAVIDDPDIVILDEPFSGLDPVNAQVLKDIIREFIKKNRIVIFSSHQMGHVEEFCDDVTFIREGKIILSGDLKEIKKKLGKNKLRLVVSNMSFEEQRGRLENISDIDITEDTRSLIIECKNDKSSNDFLRDVLEQKLPVELFSFYEPSLEDIFIKLDNEHDLKGYETVAEGEVE